MDGVAKTSLLTAAMRAAETNRSESHGRLFIDPYAEILAGPEGLALLQKAIAESGDQPAIAVRTKYIDDRFEAAIKSGIRQVVIFATGMDTRAYRLNLSENTLVIEFDKKDVLDYKKEKLKNIKPKCNLKSVAVDLREDWQTLLIQSGFQTGQPTLWLVEGLLMYLEESEVKNLLKRMNTLALINDVMLFDILSQTLLEVPHMQKQLNFLKSINAPWKFGTNDPVSFMKDFGWQATLSQPGDYAPDRWPFPTVPLSVQNVPRGYYVEARKTSLLHERN